MKKWGRFLSLKKRNGWEFVERTNAREIVAVTRHAGGRVILVEQYRPPLSRALSSCLPVSLEMLRVTIASRRPPDASS